MRRFFVLGVVGVLLLLGGCGSSGGEEDTGQAAAQSRLEVQEAKRQAAQRRAEARRQVRARARREAARQARREAQRERRAGARQARAEEAEAVEAEETIASEEEASECDPNYTGACLDPYASDYDCADGEGDGPEYTGTVTVVGEDHYGLDADSDGTGCELG